MSDISQILAALDGAVIGGGCDHCDAEGRVALVAGGCCTITIAHDDWCPTWRAIRAKRAKGRAR